MTTSMPPPPTPLAHRRTSRLISLSPPSSPECLPRKMSLPKGATFHHSSSLPTDDDPVLSIPHLARRSPTCSQSMLASWLSDKKDIAQSLDDFEQTFSGARGKRQSARRRSAQEFEQQLRIHRASLPADEALGSSVSSVSDKNLSQKFERALDLLSDKDSGLGSSIGDNVSVGRTPGDDSLAKDLIQETNTKPRTVNSPLGTRQRSRPANSAAVTTSIAPPTRTSRRHPPLSSFARKKINQNLLGPILREERFEDLHPLVTSLGSKSNKAVRCLRDLEQSLIFQPLGLAISQTLYRTFGEFTVQLVVDTYQQLSEADQRRAVDRPYDNGYFLDLVQQVGRLAAQVGRNRERLQSGTAEDDDMAYSPEDEVTLEGGLGDTGDHAELVRWKNGKGTSLRTGLPYEPLPGIKREASSMLDDDVARSMARRKKGYIPEIVEMKCSDPECDKIFTRKCDLAKHEKTHSRPFKCPDPSCKYHDLGLPTEKERDRHINDKHDPNPHFYKCDFCEFRTKRESNCKQHQEKKHNWTYERAKGKDKASNGKMTPAQTPQTPAMEYSSSMQSPAMSYKSSHWDDGSSIAGSLAGSAQLTPFDQPRNAFDTFNHAATYSNPLFPREGQQQPIYNGFDNFNQYQPQAYISPTNTTPITPNVMGTPMTPAYSNITGQSPYLANMDITMECSDNNFVANNYTTNLPTPDSFLQPHSRNPSISHHSPMYEANNNFNDPMFGQSMDMPTNDFPLFHSEGTSPFSNPAAANATLFPADRFAALDNHPMFDEGFMDEENDFVDFDAMRN